MPAGAMPPRGRPYPQPHPAEPVPQVHSPHRPAGGEHTGQRDSVGDAWWVVARIGQQTGKITGEHIQRLGKL